MAEKKTIIYTAADFHRYHSGSMSEAEMHALEKAAMEDPFLSDALDGYSFTDTAEKDIAGLSEKIAEKRKEKKRNPLIYLRPWMKIAAILIAVIGAGLLTIKFNSSSEETLSSTEIGESKKLLAKNDSAIQHEYRSEPATGMADSTNLVSAETVLQRSGVQQKPAEKNTADEQLLNKKTDADGDADSMKFAATEIAAEKQSLSVNEPSKIAAVDDKALRERTENMDNPAKSRKDGFIVKGKVVDNSGNPVAFATVVDRKNNAAVNTDTAGYFSMKAYDSIFPGTIAAIGYDRVNQNLKSSVDQTIVLPKSEQELSEVVVTGLSKDKKRNKENANAKPAGTVAQPVHGIKKFNEYIKQNIKKQVDQDGNEYEGQVILSFEINKDGSPYKIKVEKSLCASCDEEAKRLLIAGPKWTSNGTKTSRVTINF